METVNKTSPKLAAIRTYAKDLDTKRGEQADAPTEVSSPVTVAKPAEPERASDTLTAEVTKISVPAAQIQPQPEPTLPAPTPVLKPITPTKKEPTIIVENEDAASATIITDTKHGKFKLVPAIINAIKGWFSDTQKNYKAKKIPKYTVPDTTRRKGIIQKATSKSGKFAASDFSSIQERILERKAAAAKAMEAKDEPETIWTANTEPGFPLLTESTATREVTNVQVVPRKTFRTTPEVIVAGPPNQTPDPIAPEAEVVEESEDTRWSVPIRPNPVDTLPAMEATDDVPPEPTMVNAVDTVLEEPMVETVSLPVTTVEEVTPAEINQTPKSRFNILNINTNTLTMYVAGFVVALAVLATAGYLMMYKDDSNTSNVPVPDTLLAETNVSTLLLYSITDTSIIEAFSVLQNERGTTQGVFMFTSTIGSTEIVSPTDIISALGLQTAPDLAQTISAVRVGYINQAPYLLLKIKDGTAAKGGLLLWEDTMYQDLTALLSLAPEVTDTFLDATISGTDVRVLKNTNGSERLLYGMDSGTIIITTNSASYAQLTNLLK